LLCINIPNSVTYIGENACNGCAVTILVGPYHRGFRKNEAAVAAKEGYFLYREGVYFPKTVTRVCIHPSIERIPERAFQKETSSELPQDHHRSVVLLLLYLLPSHLVPVSQLPSRLLSARSVLRI
jgi:hypothetical protein